MEEIEIKFLEVDVPELEKKLADIGAERTGDTLTKVTNFDFPDYRLKSEKAWVRLRSEFGKTTIAFKQRLGVTSEDGSTKDGGMKEIEIYVDDFDKAKELLLSIGMIEKFSQERKRIRWAKDDFEFCIDTWPLVPTYIEIEGPTMKALEDISGQLGFDWSKHFIGSFGQVCQKYGFDDHDYLVMTFDKQIKR